MFAQVGKAKRCEVDRGPTGAQVLNAVQDTRLSPERITQVAQSIEPISQAGNQNTRGKHRKNHQRGMRQQKWAGKARKQAEIENASRNQGREKSAEQNKAG